MAQKRLYRPAVPAANAPSVGQMEALQNWTLPYAPLSPLTQALSARMRGPRAAMSSPGPL